MKSTVDILEFGAPLCSACETVYKVVSSVLKEPKYANRVQFRKENGVKNIALATEYGLADGKSLLESTAFPVTIFHQNGREILRRKDAFDAQELRNILDGLLKVGGAFSGVDFSGAILVRAFYDNSDQDKDFLAIKQIVQSTMAEDKLFRRVHFEWQNRNAVFARSYQLQNNGTGPITILFRDGKELTRIIGRFDRRLFEQAVVQTFQNQKMGLVEVGKKTKKPKGVRILASKKVQYAQNPQRKLRMVEFYRDNCSSCEALEPTLLQLDKKFKDWLSLERIHGEKQEEVKKSYQRKGLNDMIFYPMVFITDEEGKVLYNSDHYKNMQEELDVKIRDLLFRVQL